MWAFIPASANWIGAIPRRERASNSAAHARGGRFGPSTCAFSARR